MERMSMEKKSLSALEVYINKVYVIILILVPATCALAGLVATMGKLSGSRPGIGWLPFILFVNRFCISYNRIKI